MFHSPEFWFETTFEKLDVNHFLPFCTFSFPCALEIIVQQIFVLNSWITETNLSCLSRILKHLCYRALLCLQSIWAQYFQGFYYFIFATPNSSWCSTPMNDPSKWFHHLTRLFRADLTVKMNVSRCFSKMLNFSRLMIWKVEIVHTFTLEASYANVCKLY